MGGGLGGLFMSSFLPPPPPPDIPNDYYYDLSCLVFYCAWTDRESFPLLYSPLPARTALPPLSPRHSTTTAQTQEGGACRP